MAESIADLLKRKHADITAIWDEELAQTSGVADSLGHVPLPSFNEFLLKVLDGVILVASNGEAAGPEAAGMMLAASTEHKLSLAQTVAVVSALRRTLWRIDETREAFADLLTAVDRLMQAVAAEVELSQSVGGRAKEADGGAASLERESLRKDLGNYRRYLDVVITRSGLPTAVYDKTGVLVSANDAMKKMFGVEDLSVLYGRYNILHDEILDRSGALGHVERAFSGERVDVPPIAYNPAHESQLGSLLPSRDLWMRATAYPLLDDSGEVRFVIVEMDDASRQQPFVDVGSAAGDAVHRLLESAVDGLLVVSLDGAVLGFNNRFAEWTGYSQGDITSISADDSVFSDREERRKALHYLRRAAAGERVQFETSVVTKRGHGLCLDVTASLTDALSPPAILVSLRDATERKMAEEKQRILTRAIESATDGIAVLDSRYYLLFANRTLCRIFGYESPYEILGRGLRRMFDEPTGRRLLDEVFPMVAQKGEWRGGVVGTKKDGGRVELDVSVGPVADEAEGYQGVILVVREIPSDEAR